MADANDPRPNSNHARPPYNGASRGLVIAIDFGTRYSGVAYAFLEPGEVPKIRSVTCYPGQEDQSGRTKVPTFLYYDQEGQVQAIGAEVNDPQIAFQAIDEEWIAVEWLKLLFRPEEQRGIDAPPTLLPPGKSDVQVLADFLQYLQHAVRDYIRNKHVDAYGDPWDSLESEIIYILSHPNGWDGSQQGKLRHASELGGLIPPNDTGRSRIRFVSEGEASFHWCVDSGLAAGGFQVGDHIIVADAGGGTIDVSSFRITAVQPFQIEETRPPECSLTGSVFVNNSFINYVMDRLEGSTYDNPQVKETLAREFETKTKPLFRDSSRPSYIPLGFRPTQPDPVPWLSIRSGQLILPGKVMESFFEPSCQGLFEAVKAQLIPDCHAIIFLVGGFAASPWLYSELQNRLKPYDVNVKRADDHAAKAVTEGAIGFFLDHYIAARVARFTYGLYSCPIYDPNNPEHVAREHLVETTAAGRKYVNGGFSPHVSRGTVVDETSVHRIKLYDDMSEPAEYLCDTSLVCYRGKNTNIRWVDEDPNNFKKLCQITATLPPSCCRRRIIRGQTYYQVQYWAVLTFGTTEFSCYIEWYEGGELKRGSAMLIWDEG